MPEPGTVSMSPSEIQQFLGPSGFGVLSLAVGDDPYAVPVSYAFDADLSEFLLRLGHLDDSEKDKFLDDATPARLVVYDGEQPESVICDGTLRRLDKEALTPHQIHVLGNGETPAFDLWEPDVEDLDVSIHCLENTELTGKKPSRSQA